MKHVVVLSENMLSCVYALTCRLSTPQWSLACYIHDCSIGGNGGSRKASIRRRAGKVQR